MKLPNLKNFLNSSRGRIIISILLGFGIASLFRKSCENRNCLVFKAPSITKIKGKTFLFDEKCYKYTEKNVTCDKNKNVLKISNA